MPGAKVSILGAHTALAKAIVECIGERELGVELRLATTTEHVDTGLDLIDEKTIVEADLVVLASSNSIIATCARAARKLGKPVVDVVGAFEATKEGRYIWPGIDPDAGKKLDAFDAIAVVPTGLVIPIASSISALEEFDPIRATIVTFESAATRDREGMDELSEQTRSVFAMRDAEPRVFSTSLAFNCIPTVAVGDEDAFAADDRTEEAIRAGLWAAHWGRAGSREGLREMLDLVVSRVLVPTFSAEGAMVAIELDLTEDEAEMRAKLAGARGLRLHRGAPSLLDAVGRDDTLVGRIRIRANGIDFWLANDRLRRGSATLAALVVEQWLLSRARGHA